MGELTTSDIAFGRPAFRREPSNTRAVYSRRMGGASTAPFDSLNLGFGIGDNPRDVAANRRRFSETAGFDLRCGVQPVPDDGGRVHAIIPQDVGRGAWATDPTLVAEGLATDIPNVPLMVPFADALPVYLAAADGRAVAIVRIGRRSLLRGALRNAVDLLVTQLRVERDDISIAFGPSIGPCCYLLPEEEVAPFGDLFASCVARTEKGAHVDIRAAAALELSRLGLSEPVVDVPCTRCEADTFFSARANPDGDTGRQLAVIWSTQPDRREPGKLRLPVVS